VVSVHTVASGNLTYFTHILDRKCRGHKLEENARRMNEIPNIYHKCSKYLSRYEHPPSIIAITNAYQISGECKRSLHDRSNKRKGSRRIGRAGAIFMEEEIAFEWEDGHRVEQSDIGNGSKDLLEVSDSILTT
jgi:hypothetical protein